MNWRLVVQKTRVKRNVFSYRRKVVSDDAAHTADGRLFHAGGAGMEQLFLSAQSMNSLQCADVQKMQQITTVLRQNTTRCRCYFSQFCEAVVVDDLQPVHQIRVRQQLAVT